ncbi:hypothetical protein FRB97_003996 [Tulasnella sp. 331]|nr:hypothetical protein FRB97_003996 [Tulasnella sp. 331]KAG8887361.1 hypothetical protein FRB98_009719 [Tulasnella sp. 332]
MPKASASSSDSKKDVNSLGRNQANPIVVLLQACHQCRKKKLVSGSYHSGRTAYARVHPVGSVLMTTSLSRNGTNLGLNSQ